MKKIISLILALAVLCSLGVSAFAAGSPTKTTKVEEDVAIPTTDSNGDPCYAICSLEDDSVIRTIPVDEVSFIPVGQANSLAKEDADAFKAEYKNVKSITDKTVQSFFWLDIGDNEVNEGEYFKLDFVCKGDDITVTSNGNEMAVVTGSEMCTAKLTEVGAIAIMTK